MVKKRAARAKVRADEVEQDKENTLSVEEERIQHFLTQFDLDVEDRCAAIQKEAECVCAAIRSFTASLIVKLPKDVARLSWAEVQELGQVDRVSECDGDDVKIAGLLDELQSFSTTRSGADKTRNAGTKKTAKKPKARLPSTRTPAVGKKTVPWTDTPVVTPQFDKRLLNLNGGKPKN